MTPSRARPHLPLLLVLALLVLVVWFWQFMVTPRDSSRGGGKVPRVQALRVHRTHDAPGIVIVPEKPARASIDLPRTKANGELLAYRLAIRDNVVSLDGMQRIVGDFHRRRGPQAWMPGMWCVRLLDAEGRVLAEETAKAPDDVCVVGDPHKIGANGLPQASLFSGAGEEAMLQVRLPPFPNARLLKVYRLGSLERSDWNAEPMGELLTSISLP